jgi:hypothetical protein
MADLPITSDEGAQPVVITGAVSPYSTVAVASNGSLQTLADITSTGTIAALNGAVVVNIHGCASVTFNVTGTWVATLTFEGTTDGTNWFAIYGNQISTNVTVQAIVGNTAVTVPCGGLFEVRVIATAYTSGTANLAWDAGAGPLSMIVMSPVSGAFNATVSQPTAANLNATVVGTVTTIDSPANLSVTATGAAGAAVTATLPAVAGLAHYITLIEIVAYTTLVRTGAVAPILVTSTNLPGSNVWDFQTAQAIGTSERQITNPSNPVRSSAVNTATTIVCPATTSVIWRINVYYSTGA